MAKVSCTIIVYEDETVKRAILVEGDEQQANVGRVVERIFLDTITEELGHDYKKEIPEEDIDSILEEGRIEVNGGQTEIYICWTDKTINADTYKE